MATYNSVTINVLKIGETPIFWEQESNMVRRHIPYSNKDNIQSGGRGNFVMKISCYLTSAADLATLQASVGTTARTLGSLDGSNYSNTYLIAVRNPHKLGKESFNYWACELEFEREGA